MTRSFAVLGLGGACALGFLACELRADLGHNVHDDAGPEVDAKTELPPPTPQTPPDATRAELERRCADPQHGPIDAYPDLAGLEKRVVGRWYGCARAAMSNDPFQHEAGIQFELAYLPDARRTWHLVRATADDKAFADQRGIGNEGTWGEKYSGFIDYFQLTRTNQDSLVLVEFAFEASPRRMRVVSDDGASKVTTWLVPMGIDDWPPPR